MGAYKKFRIIRIRIWQENHWNFMIRVQAINAAEDEFHFSPHYAIL
jgi:hypothetical protein